MVTVAGGPSCPDPLRFRRRPAPPRHILLYPYVPWITAAISGRALAPFGHEDPFGYKTPRTNTAMTLGNGRVSRWWMGGLRCYDRGPAAEDLSWFYHEVFQVEPSTYSSLTYYLEIDAGPNKAIVCVKVGMPHQIAKPEVWNLESSAVKVLIKAMAVKYSYKLEVDAWTSDITTIQNSSSVDIDKKKR